MPVSISLEGLAATHGTRSLWPSEFRAFITNLEKFPDDPAQWLGLADWLHEREEYGLEDACRWYAKHQEVSASVTTYSGWYFSGLPAAVQAGPNPDDIDTSTLAGAIVMLVERLKRAREAVA